MKAYGLPRNDDVANPDCGDIKFYGLKSSAGNLRGKGGDFHNGTHSSSAKRSTRRSFKKLARRQGKKLTLAMD